MSAISGLSPCVGPLSRFYFQPLRWIPSFFQCNSSPHNSCVRRNTALTPILLLDTNDLNANWQSHCRAVVDAIIGVEDCPGAELILGRLTDQNLRETLNQVVQKIVESPDSVPIDRVVSFLNRKRMEQLVEKKATELAGQNVLQYPEDDSQITDAVQKKSDRARVLLRFIPNMLDTFLKAFNVLEVGKQPESVWDYSALIAIYITALSFPAAVLKFALPLVSTPIYAYMIALGVAVGVPLALYTYLQCFRPIPQHLTNCIDVKSMPTPLFADRERDIDRIVALIEGGFNVLIHGESGVGKSAIVREVGKRLTVKKMQQVKDEVFEAGYLSPTQKLAVDFYEAENYPSKIIFFIDEFDKVVSHENLVKTLQSRMEQKQFQLIGTCASKQYDERLKVHPQLMRRFVPYELKSPNKRELTTIILECYRHSDEAVDCDDLLSFVDNLIEKTENYKGAGAQPSAAIRVWDLAVKHILQFPVEQYETKELTENRQHLRSLQDRYRHSDCSEQNRLSDQIMNLRERILLQEAEVAVTRQKMVYMRNLIKMKRRLKLLREQDSRHVSKNDCDKQATRLLFLSYFLIDEVQGKLKTVEKELPAGVKLRLDKELIDQIIQKV